MLRKSLKRHRALLLGYGAALSVYLALTVGEAFLPLGAALGAALGVKAAAASGGRPFLALAPGVLALAGAFLLPGMPALAGLVGAVALGAALEAAPLLAPGEGAGRERVGA